MAENIYSEQLDQKTVENWSDRGGVGLADIIYNQLQDRFFNNGPASIRPMGPMPIEKGMRIKIDETKQHGIPVASPRTLPSNEVSFLYEWDENKNPAKAEVKSPYDGRVLQMFRHGDERQIVKLVHDDGLLSTLSFLGQTKDLKLGERVSAGQKLGQLSPEARGMTWQVGRAET